jgi:carbon-monoxide dehydrogenase medium subunit
VEADVVRVAVLDDQGGQLKPAPFQYHAPTSVEEAVDHLSELGDEAKVLAGGQSLIALLSLRLTRFEHLIDLRRISDLTGVETADGTVRVKAMTRQVQVERDPVIARLVPLLTAATPLIGHFQIRNQGTLGGSVAHADPASEYPAVALTLDATIVLTGPKGERRVPAAEFFLSTWVTTIEPDEVLSAVDFASWGAGSGFGVEEIARRHGDFAIAGATCGVRVVDDKIERAAIALFGMGSTPLRAPAAEAALIGTQVDAIDMEALGRLAVGDLDPPEDLHASSGYRRHVGAALVGRALFKAVQEARDA